MQPVPASDEEVETIYQLDKCLQVKIAAASLATAFLVTPRSVGKHVTHIKECLLASAAQLAWLRCTVQNVTQHLRTILLVQVPQTALKPTDGSGRILVSQHTAADPNATHVAATAGSDYEADTAAQHELSASRKTERQADSADKAAVAGQSAEQSSANQQGSKRAKLTLKSRCKTSQTLPVLQDAADSTTRGAQVHDSHLDDCIIASHEWPEYMRSPPEISLYESVLKHVQ